MSTRLEKLLLRLEWRVVRRVDGRLQGGYRTAHRGSGIDLAGLRAYTDGDDARFIDWNVTARLAEPHVRVFTEDRDLTVWLVLDTSASMFAGPPGRGKHDVLEELTLLLTRLFARGGNRVGAVLYDTGAARVVPPGRGRRHVLRLAAELERTLGPVPAGGRRTPRQAQSGAPRGTTDLAAMLDAVARVARRRALVVVVSDFIGEGDWERALLRLVTRHEVAALRVLDPADDELPEAGLIVVEDPETGDQLVVDSSDPLFRARLRSGVADRNASLVAGMRRAGVRLHQIDTDRDLAAALVEVVGRTRDRR